MQLNPQQIQHFHAFGYLHLPQLFAAEEMAWITHEFETAIQSVGGGKEHDGSRRTMFGGPIERTDKLCTLLDDPRMLGILGSILGEDFLYASGDGNYYTGDTPWHPDGNWGGLFGVKAAFYLDPLTHDTGCLRVIPGSQDPTHSVRSSKERIDPNNAQDLFGLAPRDFPGQAALETLPGDLVVFNHDLYHSAWGGGRRRRMFTMNCIPALKTEADLLTGRQYLSVHSPGGYGVDTGAGMYFPPMLDTAGEGRLVHLRQAAHIHDELFPQYARTSA
jgi:hypothetical protein